MSEQTQGPRQETDVVIRLVGESGEGTVTLGDVMVEMFTSIGLDIYTFQTFPAEIKGGTVMYQLRGRSGVTLSVGDHVDILVALNDEGFELFGEGLKPGGILLANSDEFVPPVDDTRIDIPLPITTLAKAEKEAVRSEIANEALKRLPAPINTVGLGALLRLVNAPLAPAEAYLERVFGRKGEAVVRMNISALRTGAREVESRLGDKPTPHVYPIEGQGKRMMVTGNQMLGMGALAAGVNFFGGYPITPATEVLEFIAKEIPAFGGCVIQAEDEIAALGMCLGASYAGAKAMTATSGPGLSLMVEQINLAAQAEIPVVLIDVQRGGASTGLPTKTSQGDLNLAVYGVHNESARAVVAASSVEDMFWTAVDAFNIAEEYQMPVILLSEQAIGTRRSTVPPPDLSRLQISHRLTPTDGELGPDYRRYAVTETGVSPMARPGTAGGMYTSTGIEHGETGHPAYTASNAQVMRDKRQRKLDTLLAERGDRMVHHWGEQGEAEVGIIAFGATEGVVREATLQAAAAGIRVAHLHLRMIKPLPVPQIEAFAARCKHILVPELNYSGQLAGWIRANMRIDLTQYNRDDGTPFLSYQIYDQIVALAGR